MTYFYGMQQLDLFGFPIEQPAPKKKERIKVVVGKTAENDMLQADTNASPVAATEVIATTETVEAASAILAETTPAPIEEIPSAISAEPVVAVPLMETGTTDQPEEFVEDHSQVTEAPVAENMEAPVVAAPIEKPATIAAAKTETPVLARTPAAKMEKTAAPVKQAGKRGRKSFKEMDSEADLVEVPDDETLQKKLYYSISEVAGWFKVNTSLLRYWENEFDVLQPRKTRKGDRLFRVEDIKNLQLIYFLLRQRKFSIDGAKNYLKNNRQEADTQIRLVESLTKFRSFLLEMKANLQA